MISVQTIQALILGGVLGIFVGAVPTIAYFSKKGVDIPKILEKVENTLEATEPALAVAQEALPGNKVVNVAAEIEHWAKEGVQYAQQLYHVSTITTDDERTKSAKEAVTTALKELGVNELTDNQNKLADTVILAEVNKLGHTDPTEAEKQAKEQALQDQVTQLTTERDTLKTTLNTITTAASTMQVSAPAVTQ
jgi:hypothetical protein